MGQNIAPDEGSPNDHPEQQPEIPYEQQQGTGDAEKPEEQVAEEQAADQRDG